MTDNNRSISFTLQNDKKNLSLLLTVVEADDGSLQFSYDTLGNTELRGLFFDFNNSDAIDFLQVSGSQVRNQQARNEGVTNLRDGNEMNGTGEKFDVGITFGASGKGQDKTTAGSFVLAATDGTVLTLDDVSKVMFGVRFGSVSDKLLAVSPAAPDANDDTIIADEDTAAGPLPPNSNLLANDTDGDGDPLTIVAINSDAALVGAQFVLATGGLVTVNSDGSFALDPNGQYEDLAVGETRLDSFTYRITDALADPGNQGFDTATAAITITGVNDAPRISLAAGDSDAEAVTETNATLGTAGTLTVSDVDLSDFVTASIISVATSGQDGDAALPANAALKAMLALDPAAPGILLDDTENTGTLNWSFNSNGQAFDYLAHDEALVLDYLVRATDDNGASDDRIVTITVNGSNDRPVANNVSAVTTEDTASVLGFFSASDLDTTDQLSYRILGKPMDSQGRQYGEVVNNNDGTFTFKPLDNFQFLEAGESRAVSFQYVAVDDSGTASDTSVARTATITVQGAYDAPIELNRDLVFNTSGQSMWATGEAVIIDWRDFYGVSWKEPFSHTLLNSNNIQLIPEVEVAGFDIFPGYSISTPSIGIAGEVSGRIGVSPYFGFNSGSVDSTIPVAVDLTYKLQYEDGDEMRISTGYTIDGAASFNTISPNIVFGMDLVFEFGANASFNIGSWTGGGATSFDLFPAINVNVDEAEPVPGYPTSGNGDTATLFEFSSSTGIASDIFKPPVGLEGDYVIPIFDDSSLTLSFPFIEAEGELVGPSRLEGSGSDELAVLTLDLDDILSQPKKVPPMRITGEEVLGFSAPVPQFVKDAGFDSFEIFKAAWDFELVDVDLIGTLLAVQDFTLDITELPLMITLENGDSFGGFKLGSDIVFEVPDWDVDNLGDKDGQMDYTIDIDIEAMFNNWTTLDFTLDLVVRLLKANVSLDTIFTDPVNLNLFGNAGNGWFLATETFNLLNVSPLAELFGNEDPEVSGFGIIGWNSQAVQNAFDIA